MSRSEHVSVMAKECAQYFEGKHIETFFEGTTGAGGHAAVVLEHHPEIRRYLACDRDESAIELAKVRLQPWSEKIDWIHGNFADLDSYLEDRGILTVDGFFLTLECHLCN